MAKQATTTAKKIAVLKERAPKSQVPNMARCTSEPDNSVEVQEEDWYCFTCKENVVPDMIHFTRCKKYDVSTMQEICPKIVLN